MTFRWFGSYGSAAAIRPARRMCLAVLLGLLAILPGVVVAWSAPLRVDLELVLAVDVSGSVDEEEGRLQRMGYVDAFRSPSVLRAIQSGRHKRIAVTYVEWAGSDWQVSVVGWRQIHDKASAGEFAALLAEKPVGSGPYTSISGAIEFSLPLFDNNGFMGERRIIDISGDGPNNSGDYVTTAREKALRAGVTINGLPIVNSRPSPWGRAPMAHLDLYYRKCVIGGRRAFLVVAKDFGSFGRAIRRKLILEIVGLPERRRGPRQAPDAAQRAKRVPVLVSRSAPPCDAGERRRRSWAPDY